MHVVYISPAMGPKEYAIMVYAYSYAVVLEPMQLIQREICILTAYLSIGWRSLKNRYWHEQIPAPKNVTIILWLDQHNIN